MNNLWLEIDLSAIKHNLELIRKCISPDVEIMAVVKSNAYGHGMIQVARLLEELGVNYFGVANIKEAVELRNAGIKKGILNLGYVDYRELDSIVKYNITITLFDLKLAHYILLNKKVVKAHIKVDTGMGRFGIKPSEFDLFYNQVRKNIYLKIEGIYTHFSSADKDPDYTKLQLKRFNMILKGLNDFKYIHAANSAGIINCKESHFNMVRPGILLYGCGYKKLNFKKALFWKTKVIYIKNMSKGEGVGYGREFICKKDTKIALLPVGYSDGYSSLLSNKGFVLINDVPAPIIGRISMNNMMIDVGHLNNISIGDEVILVGDGISVDALAAITSQLYSEVLTGISSKIFRKYLK